MRNNEKRKMEQVRQQAYQHAQQNSQNDRASSEKESEQTELIKVLQEESSNLKAKMIQLTEENNKLRKDKAKLTQSAGAEHREQIERQKEEIRTLKGQIYQQSSEKGL